MTIPAAIIKANIYEDGLRYNNHDGTVTLPDIKEKTATIGGAGMLGESEIPILGALESMTAELKFNSITDKTVSLSRGYHKLDIRAAMQEFDVSGQKTVSVPIKAVIGGYSKEFKSGELKSGDPTGTSATLEVMYYKLDVGGKNLVEIDKLSNKYIIDGTDYMAELNGML